VVAVVEDLADAATCALGDFAGAFGGSYADVLASYASALADVAGGVDGVEGDKIARPLPTPSAAAPVPLPVPLPMSPAPLPTSPPGLRVWDCGGV
jgi:hypothetical protein